MDVNCSTVSLETTFMAECVGFGMSISMNTILCFLISEKTKAQLGNYRNLMMSFALIGMFYSSLNLWSKPNMFITDTAFIVFTNLRFSWFSKFFGSIVITIYCSCYAMLLSVLAIHFFYRYTSVTSPMKLASRFSWKTIPVWSFCVFVYSAVWGLSSYFLCGPTETKDIELEKEFRDAYCLEPEEYAYVGPQYFTAPKADPSRTMHIPSVIGMAILAIQMSSTFLCVMYFGVRTYRTLNELGIAGYASKKLQKQLFRALVIQTCIPCIFLYFPVTCLFVFPIFGLRIESMAIFIPISLAIYPCLEPLVAMYVIKDFRRRIKGVLTCAKWRGKVGVFRVESTTATNHAMTAIS